MAIVLAIVLASIASGVIISIWFFGAPLSFRAALSSLPLIGIVVGYSFVVTTAIGVPTYHLLARAGHFHWPLTTLIGAAAGAAIGLVWGHSTMIVFTTAGLVAGLVGGLVARSNKSLERPHGH